MKAILKNNQGIAMVVVIAVMVILLSITGATLLFSGLSLKASANLQSGSGAIHAADAGIQHALAVIPAGTYFDSFLSGTSLGTGFTCGSPCDGTTAAKKPTLTGSLSGYTYSVVAENDADGGMPVATDDTNRLITLTSTATGPNSSSRKIKAFIGRSSTNSWVPPGAVYMQGVAADVEFQVENGSVITGNDTNVDGTPGPLAAVPGIATNDALMTTNAIAAIETPANVTGAGGTPSVATSSSTIDVTQMANDFLTNSYTSVSAGTVVNASFGSWTSPRITYVNGALRLRGTSSGAGVLIVDGSLRIEDTFDFKGLIILRLGGELRLEIGATSPIYGAILLGKGTTDLAPELDWRGGALRYSSEAINKVQSTWPAGGISQKAKLIAWQEVMQ